MTLIRGRLWCGNRVVWAVTMALRFGATTNLQVLVIEGSLSSVRMAIVWLWGLG